MNYLLTLVAAFLIFSTSLIQAQDVLPSAELVNNKGETVDIKKYTKSGSPKLISLWATWCGPCRMELNALKKVSQRWKEDYDVEIVAISVDMPQMVNRARAMFEKNGWDYTFLHDSNQELMSKLGIQNIPYSMLIDGDGNIQSVQMGYYPDYEKHLEKKIKQL